MRGDKMITKKCEVCQKEYLSRYKDSKFCSRKCSSNRFAQPTDKNKQIMAVLKVVYKACDNKMPSGIYTELAETYNLSRQRIHQISKLVEIPKITPKTYFYVCEICGKTIEEKTKKKRLICSIECRNEKAKRYIKTHTVESKCLNCGNTFSYFKGKWDLTRTFCSKQCQGYKLAKEKGFAFQVKQNEYINKSKLNSIYNLLSTAPTKLVDGKQVFYKDELLTFLTKNIETYKPLGTRRPNLSKEAKQRIALECKGG